jgi:hypothetical protein
MQPLLSGESAHTGFLVMKTKGPNVGVSRAFGIVSSVQELNAMKWSQNPISPLHEAGFCIYLKDELRSSKSPNGCVAPRAGSLDTYINLIRLDM